MNDTAASRLGLADDLARRGDIAGAIRTVEALAADAPGSWEARERLGELHVRANDYAAAAAHFRAAAERKPNDASLLYKWARATFDAGAPGEAKVILDEAARLAPGHELILNLYAEIHAAHADWNNLGRTAQAWLHVEPRDPRPWFFAATAQWETGYLAHAIASYRTFLDRGGANATNLATFGRLCLAAHAYDEASAALGAAERLDAGCAHMLSAKATLAMFQGRLADAVEYARRALGADPRDAAAFKVLVQVSGGALTADERAQLERLSEDAGAPPQERIAAAFALADCLDAQGDVDAAFAAYSRANALGEARAQRESLGYDRRARQREIDRLITRFPDAPPAAPVDTRGNASGGAPGSLPGDARGIPIFIVGMPRSGTTFVESILAAHSGVVAGGERQPMRAIMQEYVATTAGAGLGRAAESTRQRWRKSFWDDLPLREGALAVTDKNPWNFDALGAIFALLPRARVLHVRRDPVETGLSIFRNEFPKFVSFAHRLDDIGHYYGEYLRLMAHWERLLGERLLTIRYEDLIADVAAGARAILGHCGLPYEDACAHPAAGERIIGTLSAVQSRRPVGDFAGRRDRYERHLGPLVDALRESGVDLRSGARVAPRATPG